MSPLAEEHPDKFEKMSPEQLEVYKTRHSMAHVMASAIVKLLPGTKCGFGPPVENGFYYDFDLPRPLSTEDFEQIEKLMRQVINGKQAFEHENLSIAAAREMMIGLNQPFKVELIDELAAKGLTEVSVYRHGDFVDICEGPHVEHVGKLKPDAFKLDSIAGAYWRGSEKNPMLTRVYALSFESKQALKDFIARREEALKRDHRKLGAELDIFHISEEVGKGLPLWLPNGVAIRDELEKLAKEYEFKYGYVRVRTPEIGRDWLYRTSGHLAYYTDSMFPPMKLPDDEETYYLKPMNCPHHHMIFKARQRSYRDMPLRFSEYGNVYRYEKSGELAGLLRVRGMSMNDAHLYVREDQIKEEFKAVMRLHLDYYQLLGITDYYMRLSLHSDEGLGKKYVDNKPLWLKSEAEVREAMDELGMAYVVREGEAAFYGPKIDVQIRNVVGREETASTNQLDFASAERFDLTYIGSDGAPHRPVILHRAPLGTHERFIAFLIEHYGGAFPTWLAPVQVVVIPVSMDQEQYARNLVAALRERFVRAELDDSSESFNKKIRTGAVRKVPILLVVGQREAEEGKVTVRRYRIQRQESMAADAFIEMLMEELRTRRHVKPEEG